MRRFKDIFGRVWTPQILVCLVFCGLIAFGFACNSAAKAQHVRLAVVSSALIATTEQMVAPAPTPTTESVDCALVPCLAITFDDGPSAEVTPRVLDILKSEGVHATFFVVGSHVVGNEALLRRMYNEGHEIGNHTWSHHDLKQMSGAQIRNEIRSTQIAVMNAGVPAPHVFRPPYGAADKFVTSQIQMSVAQWNVDPEDWKLKDPNVLRDRLINQARPGGVIVMHDVHASTADALTPALRNLKTRFHLVTVSQLFDIQPGGRGEFFGR